MSSFRSLKCSGYLWIGVNYSYRLNCWWLLVLFQENDCWWRFYSRIMILFNFSWMLLIYHVRWTDNWNIHWGMRTESKVESFCFVWQNLVLDRLGIAVTTKGNLTPGSKTCLLKSELNEIILFWRPIEGLNLVFGNTCLDWTDILSLVWGRQFSNFTICASIFPCVILQQNFENQRICQHWTCHFIVHLNTWWIECWQ